MSRTAVLFVLLAVPAALFAQSPAADWYTVETPHFRVHYPREYEEWALRAAERLEDIRDAVTKEVGFAPPQTIDVLVVNPIAQPNGAAWPLLDTPRMILFAEPPAPDEQIGAYGHWIDVLAVHETAHLVHMLRPSRNPLARLAERSVLPFNPVTLRAPRWVLEGYATVIEGRLTGAGRPTSTIRALILRRWAESGRLPSYAQLSSDRRFLGMSMAYLMGSAFLEWLEQQSGPDALRNLWARLTARRRRSFDEAFIGVFGGRPDRLYGRFVAELTASAVAIRRASEFREGELFQETPRASGDPAVSPDGKQIAVVIRNRDTPQRLVVWSTEPAVEEETKFRERLERMLERDPEDVAPVRTRPLPRTILQSLTMPDGGEIETPRWMPDGTAIVFSHRMPDGDGVLHYDLFRWTPESGELTRITRLADVRDADPLPDGRTAVAVRSRGGASQLVTVNMLTGEVTPRTTASIDIIETHPRVSPDGNRIAHVVHRTGAWALYIDDTPIALPGVPSSPAWISNDELVVTLFARGFAELHRVTLGGDAVPISRATGGAFEPAPAPDGRVFFMSLDPDGYVVRVLPSIEPAPAPPELDPSLVPAIPPPQPEPIAFAPRDPGTPRPYGIGRQELFWLAGTNLAPDYRSTEIGLRLGDVVGRLDTLLLGALGSRDGVEGIALATAWRGWPVEVHAHLFTTNDDDGAELRGVWSRRFPLSRLAVEAGALSDELLFGRAAFSTRQVIGRMRFEESVSVEADASDEGTHYRVVAGASFRGGSLRLAARYQRDGGEAVTIGGLASSILPRSAYARRVLDPALPAALLAAGTYNGWRIESSMPLLPFTAFYQRHDTGTSTLSLAGGEVDFRIDPNPIVKLPGLAVTAGAAYIFDAPLRGETNWWLGVRWRP